MSVQLVILYMMFLDTYKMNSNAVWATPIRKDKLLIYSVSHLGRETMSQYANLIETLEKLHILQTNHSSCYVVNGIEKHVENSNIWITISLLEDNSQYAANSQNDTNIKVTHHFKCLCQSDKTLVTENSMFSESQTNEGSDQKPVTRQTQKPNINSVTQRRKDQESKAVVFFSL